MNNPNQLTGRRNRAVCFGIAIGLHLALLLPLLLFKTPATIIDAAGDDQISLVSAPGLITTSTTPITPPRPPKPRPPPPAPPSPPTPTLPSERAGDDLQALLKLKPIFDPTADVERIFTTILASGAPTESLPVVLTPLRAQAAAPLTPEGGKACQIVETLQADLQASEPVRHALPQIPTRARSVANAVMLWDGQWVDLAAVGGVEAVGPIQQAVRQDIAAAPLNCREELVRGPRLITIGDAQNTIVLAFGSGEWHWADLLSISPPTHSQNSQTP